MKNFKALFALLCLVLSPTLSYASDDLQFSNSESDEPTAFEALEPIAIENSSDTPTHSNQFMDQIDPNLTPVKVVGRGLQDKKTDQILQLACVGNTISGSLERSCQKLRFLLTQRSGAKSFVGPILEIANPNEKIRSQIHEQLKERQLTRDLFYSRKFKLVRLCWLDLFGNGKKYRKYSQKFAEVDKDYSQYAFMGLMVTAPFVTSAVNAGRISLAAGIGGLTVLGFFSPVIFDIAFLPFDIIADRKNSDLNFGFNAKNVESLQSRATTNWPVAAKGTQNKRFQTVLGRLIESDEKFPVQMITSEPSAQNLKALGIDIQINWTDSGGTLLRPDASSVNPSTSAQIDQILQAPCLKAPMAQALKSLQSPRLLQAFEDAKIAVKNSSPDKYTKTTLHGMRIELWISSNNPNKCMKTESSRYEMHFVAPVIYWDIGWKYERYERNGSSSMSGGGRYRTYSKKFYTWNDLDKKDMSLISLDKLANQSDHFVDLIFREVDFAVHELKANREPQ